MNIKTTRDISPKPCICKTGKWQYIQTPENFFEAFICEKHGNITKIRTILFNSNKLTKINSF